MSDTLIVLLVPVAFFVVAFVLGFLYYDYRMGRR